VSDLKYVLIRLPILLIVAYLFMGLMLHILAGLPIKSIFTPKFAW